MHDGNVFGISNNEHTYVTREERVLSRYSLVMAEVAL